jgi:hypothetical protein
MRTQSAIAKPGLELRKDGEQGVDYLGCCAIPTA